MNIENNDNKRFRILQGSTSRFEEVIIYDAETNTAYPVVSASHIRFIERVGNSEVIVCYEEKGASGIYKDVFTHVGFTRYGYKTIFNCENCIAKEQSKIGDNKYLLVMEDASVLYNSKLGHYLASDVIEETSFDGEELLIGRMTIDDIDEISYIINPDTLETNGIYSKLQQRYIPLIKKESYPDDYNKEYISFRKRFIDTINKEIKPYGKYIKDLDDYLEYEEDKSSIIKLYVNAKKKD